MNLSTSQLQALARGQRIKPCFKMFCNWGQELALQLKPIRTTAEVAKNLGMTDRMVQVIGCVALGKIAYALRELDRKQKIEPVRLVRRVRVLEGHSQGFSVSIRNHSVVPQESAPQSKIDYTKIPYDLA